MSLRKLAVPIGLLALLAACQREGAIVEGGGISAVRSTCPIVAVPAGTGDITLFDPADRRDADAIDVVAVLTNVESTCTDVGDLVVTEGRFDVHARRAEAGAARSVTLPYFVTIVRGGTSVVAKRIGEVTVNFAPGELRASATGSGRTSIGRAAVTLPEDVRRRLTERRRPGEEAAAGDPLTDPTVRQAVLASTFEALVGFQLTEDQLRYNATR